jgi:ABC-2 type transport system permease protein
MAAAVKGMTMLDLLIHEIRSRGKAILAWGIGLSMFGAVYISIAPELFEQLKSLSNLSVYKWVGLYLESIEDYFAFVILAYISFLLGIYSIIISTATLAGEEDNGTLELLIVLPYARWKIMAVKIIALAAVLSCILFIAAAGNAIGLAILNSSYPLSITPLAFFAALISSLPLLLVIIVLGILLGSILPNRKTAAVVSAVYFVVSYFGKHIAYFVKPIEWLKYACLFNYYNTTGTIFTNGIVLSDIVVLLGVSVLFFMLSIVFFKKRNISVGTLTCHKIHKK